MEELSYFQVDSPVARPTDVTFLGLHRLAEAEMSSKVVSKQEPGEKVGVLGRADGKLGCIEYSDLPDTLRNARDDEGQLLFRAGNIANHVMRRDFLERLTSGGELRLPWHLARKSLATIDDSGAPTADPSAASVVPACGGGAAAAVIALAARPRPKRVRTCRVRLAPIVPRLAGLSDVYTILERASSMLTNAALLRASITTLSCTMPCGVFM